MKTQRRRRPSLVERDEVSELLRKNLGKVIEQASDFVRRQHFDSFM